MHSTVKISLPGLICLLLGGGAGAATEKGSPEDPTGWFTPEHATAQLVILGTFHFKDAGLDSYKPEVDIDILSEARQRELEDVLSCLERFGPTKILIEVDAEDEEKINERYGQFLVGNFELGANEIYQVGFRLARRLQHERLYAVDASGRPYEDLPDTEVYAEEHGQSFPGAELWSARYMDLYRYEDHLKAGKTLREHLLFLNSEERLRLGHGHYVLSSVALGTADEYPAADQVTGWWYNRNLRIYARILRAMEPGDRLLLLIGACHVPIIRHAADGSPEIDLIDVADVLGDQ